MKKFNKIALALTVALASMNSFAQEKIDTPAALEQAVKQGGVSILKKFEAVGGLTGYVVKRQGQSQVVYTSADGRYLMVGAVIDVAGRNLTDDFADKHVPKPDYSKMVEIMSKKGSYTFTTGTKTKEKSHIYVIVDPNCVYCYYKAKAVKPFEEKGLKVTWLPVGFLRPDSAGKAAAIMESKNPELAWKEHIDKFKQGGISAKDVTPDAKEKLNKNAELMNEYGFSGTPAFLFKGKDGKWQAIGGMATISQLKEITGIDDVNINDPELEKFR